MVAKIILFAFVGLALADNEPLQDAFDEEDECRAKGDCSMNALQRAATKLENEDESDALREDQSAEEEVFADEDEGYSMESAEEQAVDEERSEAEIEEELEAQRRFLEEFPEGASTLEYFNETTWSSFLQMIPENEGDEPADLVKELNHLYNSHHTGVFQRLVYSRNAQPWYTSSQTMSWAVMNQYAWDSYSHGITIFNFHGPASGIIAKPSAMKIPGVLKCTFPCDGYSDHRYYDNRGCGCGKTYYGTKGLGTQACPASGTDWCDQYGHHLHNFKFRGNGIPCAYKPSETGRMLQQYHRVKTGRAGKAMQNSCSASWLRVSTNGNSAWNEAVVSSAAWNKAGGTSLIAAFVLPSSCLNSWSCKNGFWMWYMRFKMAGKGKRPVVVMDLTKQYSPYRLLDSNDR